jgi:hypothetical protein
MKNKIKERVVLKSIGSIVENGVSFCLENKYKKQKMAVSLSFATKMGMM